jgi:hypothetical protein
MDNKPTRLRGLRRALKWLDLQWYNCVRRHWDHFWFRRRYFDDWCATGHDPKMFRKPAPLRLSDIDWAMASIAEIEAESGRTFR